jgi:hypothetical protein
MRLYRARFVGWPGDVDDMRSNYERNRSTHPEHRRATVLHMAVSMFENRDVVATLCLRNPQRLGEYIAEVDLEPGKGVCVARTGSTGHWSVWGRPAQLKRYVSSVVRA